MTSSPLELLSLIISISVSACSKQSDLQLLDGLLVDYDRRATPTNHKDDATNVTCEFYIRSFGSIDPSSMDYQVDLYLRQSWVDERLNHADFKAHLDLNDPALVKAIWKPEVYFPNAKRAEFQYVTVPNVLVRINPLGRILYMLRLKLTFACMMEMSKFPLDSQVCTMEIASFSKTTKELTLSWRANSPIKMYKHLKMPQFQIERIVHATCRESIQIGNYSCLVAEFHLKRSIGFHLVQSYLPTTLIVAISWVSFWMDVDSVPARTTLGVTTLLAVSTKSGIQDGLPQVSYVKAIDVWMGACTAFVFTSLIEFTVVNCLWRKGVKGGCGKSLGRIPSFQRKRNSFVVAGPQGAASVTVVTPIGGGEQHQQQQQLSGGKKTRPPDDVCGGCCCSSCSSSSSCFAPDTQVPKPPRSESFPPMKTKKKPQSAGTRQSAIKSTNYMVLAQQIDESCRILFPFFFGCFNVCYWSYYFLL